MNKIKDGKYYIDIINNIIVTEEGEDAHEIFKGIDLNLMCIKLGLDINGDFFYVTNGVITNTIRSNIFSIEHI